MKAIEKFLTALSPELVYSPENYEDTLFFEIRDDGGVGFKPRGIYRVFNYRGWNIPPKELYELDYMMTFDAETKEWIVALDREASTGLQLRNDDKDFL